MKFNLLFILAFAPMSLSLLQQAPTPINPNNPIDVCEVLGNLPRYRGKVIEVRGEWKTHVTLGGECKGLKLQTGDYEWTHEVLLTVPGSIFAPQVGDKDDVSWRGPDANILYYTSLGAKADLARRVDPSQKPGIMVTMVGRLDARLDDKDQLQLRFGLPFGYYEIFPARLVVAGFKDIVLTQGGKPIP